MLNLPKTLKTTHLPVYILKKEKNFYNNGMGFIEEENRNDLHQGDNYIALTGNGKEIPLSFFDQIIDFWKNEKIDTYAVWEIPFQYYIGNFFVDNRIKIYTRKAYTVTGSGVQIFKIVPSVPLVKDMLLKIDDHGFDAGFDNFYSHFKVIYKGAEVITFVREFADKVVGHELIKDGHLPFFLSKEGSCYKIDLKNNKGTEKQECKFGKEQFSYLFKQYNNKSSAEVAPLVIELPEDEVVSLGILVENKISQLKLIKHFVVNPEWAPLDLLPAQSCDGAFIKKPKDEEKINYLGETKIVRALNSFSDSDLICIRVP